MRFCQIQASVSVPAGNILRDQLDKTLRGPQNRSAWEKSLPLQGFKLLPSSPHAFTSLSYGFLFRTTHDRWAPRSRFTHTFSFTRRNLSVTSRTSGTLLIACDRKFEVLNIPNNRSVRSQVKFPSSRVLLQEDLINWLLSALTLHCSHKNCFRRELLCSF
jgi:hypothetical protein